MNKKLKKYRLYYGITIAIAVLLVIITLSPLTIPHNQYKPELAGLPYSLWMGILTTVALVFLTYVATRIHPGSVEEKMKRKETQND